MTPKTTKKKTYTEDQALMLLEDVRDQFVAFGEGLHVVADKVDKLEGRFDVLERRFDRLETKVDSIQGDVKEIKHVLGAKVDVTDFRKLEKRVVRVENIVLMPQKKIVR